MGSSWPLARTFELILVVVLVLVVPFALLLLACLLAYFCVLKQRESALIYYIDRSVLGDIELVVKPELEILIAQGRYI